MKKRVSVQGHTIVYDEFGQGPYMLFLHGYGGSPHDWRVVAQNLSQTHTVIVPNFSPIFLDVRKPTTFTDQVRLVSLFLKRTLPENAPVKVVASSYGGALAWALAIDDPRRVERLILLGPMPPFPSKRIRSPALKALIFLAQWPEALWVILLTPWGKKLVPRLNSLFNVEWLRKRSREMMTFSKRKIRIIVHVIQRFSWIIHDEDWSYWEGRIRFIETPTCFIWGTEDRLFENQEPQRFHLAIPHSSVYFVEKAGHTLMKQKPELVLDVIEKFLQPQSKIA